ncbi:MAG: putative 4-hydroxybenzoate polyprenyltransferase [Planctomycetales bacterium]|nr:putative 4-hydroxybenzoate polyprenyltransferase [Planctomycetales bacterium]
MNQPTTKSLLRRFLELIRFSHTVFALPFAALACVMTLALPWQGDALSPLQVAVRVVGVLLCMVSARSAAMAFNRLVDAELDARNPRTAGRHLPSGELTRRQAWYFFGGMCFMFAAACFLFLPNWLPLAGAAPVLLWICGYSFAKRFTSAAHLWLGVALALSPVCAWLAMRGEMVLAMPSDVLPACGLGLAIALWVAGFDIIYACQDAEFDQAAGLHSLPARYGVAGALRIAATLHLLMLAVLAALPFCFPQLSLGWIYGLALSGVALLVIRQHAIVGPRELGRVNEAFFQINAVISFGLALLAAVDTCLR